MNYLIEIEIFFIKHLALMFVLFTRQLVLKNNKMSYKSVNSSLLNNQFRLVDYKYKSLRSKQIIFNKDKLT